MIRDVRRETHLKTVWNLTFKGVKRKNKIIRPAFESIWWLFVIQSPTAGHRFVLKLLSLQLKDQKKPNIIV